MSRLSLLSLPVLGLAALPVLAQLANGGREASETGSRLGPSVTPSQVVMMEPPREVRRVRTLMQDGRHQEALQTALDYLAEVEERHPRGDVQSRYYAHNALCGVYTMLKELDEAVISCSTAMTYMPFKWSAVNNRGTAHLTAGRYDEALVDYRRALELAPNEGAEEAIRHNIRLVRDRQGGN